MSGKTKIVVLKLKELICAGIFLVLGILAVILLAITFSNKEESASPASQDSSAIYVPGTYTTAMVLNGSNVLILDEPTRNFSPLSAPVIRQVLADFPGCIISVSHDRQYLTQVCDRVLELSPTGLRQTFL